MTSTVPTAVHDEQHAAAQADPPITMFGPDFPYAYDDYLAHPAGIGSVPATEHGSEVAVIGGGLSGIVAAQAHGAVPSGIELLDIGYGEVNAEEICIEQVIEHEGVIGTG